MSDFIKSSAERVIECMKNHSVQGDVVVENSIGCSVSVFNREIDTFESYDKITFSARVIKDNKQASVSFSDIGDVDNIIVRAIEMASASIFDPNIRLADQSEYISEVKHLNIYDDEEISHEFLKKSALEMEDAALSVDGISRTDAVTVASQCSKFVLCTTNDFSNGYARTLLTSYVGSVAEKK